MVYPQHTLANGIRVVHIPSVSPVAYCAIMVNAGSRDEQINQHGLAHYVEHTVFKGTTHRSATQILNRLDAVGGELNAYTTKEITAYHAAFLPEHLYRALDLLADMVLNPTFPEAEILKEKEVIADEISSYKDTPAEQIYDDFERMLFSDLALSHSILGTNDSLAHFTANDLRNFVDKYYVGENIVVAILGNFKTSRVFKLAESIFGPYSWSHGKHTRPKVSQELNPTRRKVEIESHQGHVIIGHVAPSSFEDERVAMSIITNILGGPNMNARLSVLLREKNGIAYNVEAEYSPFEDTGLFTIYFGTDAGNIDKSIRIVRRELKKLCENGLSDAALKAAKRQINGQIMMTTDDSEARILAAARSVLLYGDARSEDEVCNAVEKVSRAQLLSVAQTYLLPTNLSELVFF